MKVNINVEIDDAARNVLAQLLDGKSVKRLATRDEVRELVAALIGSLATAPEYPPALEKQDVIHPIPDLGGLAAVANARVAEMRAEGKGEEYIQRWLRGFAGKPKKGIS